MDLSVSTARLQPGRSDEKDLQDLVNDIRDGVMNREGRYYRSLTTTDATVTAGWTMELGADTAIFVMARVVAYDADAQDGSSFWRRATVKRVGTADAVMVGAVQTPAADQENDASWDFTLAVSAGSIEARVTGAAGQTIAWHLAINVLEAPWVQR